MLGSHYFDFMICQPDSSMLRNGSYVNERTLRVDDRDVTADFNMPDKG